MALEGDEWNFDYDMGWPEDYQSLPYDVVKTIVEAGIDIDELIERGMEPQDIVDTFGGMSDSEVTEKANEMGISLEGFINGCFDKCKSPNAGLIAGTVVIVGSIAFYVYKKRQQKKVKKKPVTKKKKKSFFSKAKDKLSW